MTGCYQDETRMKVPRRRNRMFCHVTSVCDPLCAPTTTPVLLATIVPGATADSPALLLVVLHPNRICLQVLAPKMPPRGKPLGFS